MQIYLNKTLYWLKKYVFLSCDCGWMNWRSFVYRKVAAKRRLFLFLVRGRGSISYFLNGPNAAASIAPTLIRHWLQRHLPWPRSRTSAWERTWWNRSERSASWLSRDPWTARLEVPALSLCPTTQSPRHALFTSTPEKRSPYSVTERRVPEPSPVLGSQKLFGSELPKRRLQF